jgi:hypothetical protein
MRQEPRRREITLLPSLSLSMLLDLTWLSYFADAAASVGRHLLGMLYFRACIIDIDRGTSGLPLDPLHGLLTVLQLIHRHLCELLLGDHGITGNRPDPVLKWIQIILTPCRHCRLPIWLRPSLSNLHPNSDAPQICMQHGLRPCIFTLLSLLLLSILLDSTSLSCFADAFVISPGD